jgi:hypothetical protein
MAKANGKTWIPPHDMPALEKIEAAIGALDLIFEQRPWLAGRRGVDVFATDYTVTALATLLIQHGVLVDGEIDYYRALVEYRDKKALEEQTRVPEAAAAPAPRVLLPGRDF